MTLPELAALAEKVEGFERPVQACRTCGGYGDATPGWRYTKCECEAGDGCEWDNSPAALLMAVVLHRCKTQKPLLGRGHGIFCLPVDAAPDTRESPESIARAALVALLRAHGVEVPNAE